MDLEEIGMNSLLRLQFYTLRVRAWCFKIVCADLGQVVRTAKLKQSLSGLWST